MHTREMETLFRKLDQILMVDLVWESGQVHELALERESDCLLGWLDLQVAVNK